jgi:hypothetical protein
MTGIERSECTCVMEHKKRGEVSGAIRDSRLQFRAEAPLEFGADFTDLDSGGDDEFAAQEFARLVVIRKATRYTAILAFLIPAKAAVGNRLRADVLEAAQNGVLFRDLELLPLNRNLDEFLVMAEDFGHTANLLKA